jgi:hypothetical protein
LIVGCGPAGLTLAAQLAAFPQIRTRIIDQKSGRLIVGQADGVACRTMEMFEAFGFSERVLKEAYWVNETSFWKPDDIRRAHIVRGGRIQDTEDELSELPHVILNQARVHDFYLDAQFPDEAGAGLFAPIAGSHDRRLMRRKFGLSGERQARAARALGPRVRIPTKPATHSNRKPATDSDLKPAGIPI